MPKEIKFSLFILFVFFLLCGPTFGGHFSATKRTTSAYNKVSFQLQVVGSKVYYVWDELDEGFKSQIWTAEMNTDGTGWSATKRTDSTNSNLSPQFHVVGEKIFYVWSKRDGFIEQIWTAEMNTNGTGWSETKRTDSAYYNMNPQLQVVGGKIYYVWEGHDGSNWQIWTAEMNADGTGWSAAKRTTSVFDKGVPQQQVVSDKIYYVWFEYDGSKDQIWTGEMNTNGTGWSATKRTNSAYTKWSPQLQVVDSKIYYAWDELNDGSDRQIWTAEMNTDGTGWSATKRTTSAYTKWSPRLQVVGSRIYYVWTEEDDSSKHQISTAQMNTARTGWSATKRTTSAYDKYEPKFQVVGSKIYYVWREDDGSNYQIWTAVERLSVPTGMILLLLGG